MQNLQHTSSALRSQKLTLRDGLSVDARHEKSESMARHLAGLRSYQEADCILYFVNFRSEIATLPVIQQALTKGKTVGLPRTLLSPPSLLVYGVASLTRDLQPGYCNIPEPDPARCVELDPATLDVVIVPGSVFDKRGGRMGYGGGYYDRFLADCAPQAIRIGVCFEVQMVDLIPLQPHDQLLDFIVTEDCVYDCLRGKISAD